MQDWDHVHGTLDSYKIKREKIDIEMGLTIGLNFLVNFFMLVPMWVLRHNVNDRHDFLVATIEPMPEEVYAHWIINFLAIDMVLILLFAALIQFLFYMVYNRYHHPFHILLIEGKLYRYISLSCSIYLS